MGDKHGQVTVFIIIGVILIASFFLISLFVEKRADSDFNAEEMLSDGIGQRFDKQTIEEYYLACIEDLAKDSLFLYSPNRLINFIETNIRKCAEIEEWYPQIEFTYGTPEIKVKKTTDGAFYNIYVDYHILMEGKNYNDFLKSFDVKIPIKEELKLKLDDENRTISTQELNILDGKIKLVIPNGTRALKNGKSIDEISYELVRDEDQNIIIDFKPEGTVFSKGVELKFSYNGLVFPKDFEVTRNLRVGLYDEKYGKFMIVSGSYVNTTSKEIVAPIKHFSSFTWGVIRFNGSCDDGVGFDYTEFDELVNQTFTEIMTLHTNGSVNETVLRLGIANLMIEANGYNQTWFNFTELYWAEENLTQFNIFTNFSNMTMPLSYVDDTSDGESCDGPQNLSITQEINLRGGNHIWVGNPTSFKPERSSESINIDKPGRYVVFGEVDRREFGDDCQAGEEFHLEINGYIGQKSEDDNNPCRADQNELEYLGQYDLSQGVNTINMVYDGTTEGANSVSIDYLYINHMGYVDATYFWIDNDGNEIRFEYQKVLPRVKSLSVDIEGVGKTFDTGFISMTVFNDKIYAGTYDITTGKPKIYSYPEWKLEAEIPAGESVYAMTEFKDRLYLATESRGQLYKSQDGSKFELIKTSENNLGLGIVNFKNALYSTFTSYEGNTGKGPILYKTNDGNTITEVAWPPVNQKCVVYAIREYDGKMYASTFCDNYGKTKVYTSSDGDSWTLLEEVQGTKGYKVVKDGKFYGVHKKDGKVTVFSYDGNNWENILETSINLRPAVLYKGDIYFATGNCWKSCAPGLHSELYKLDLEEKKLKKIYSFDEPNIDVMVEYQGYLYAASRSGLAGPGKVYKLDINEESNCIKDQIDISQLKHWNINTVKGKVEDFHNMKITTELTKVEFMRPPMIHMFFEKPESWNPNWVLFGVCYNHSTEGLVCSEDDGANYGRAGFPGLNKFRGNSQGYPYGIFVYNNELTERSNIYYVDRWPNPSTHESYDECIEHVSNLPTEDGGTIDKSYKPFICHQYEPKVSMNLEMFEDSSCNAGLDQIETSNITVFEDWALKINPSSGQPIENIDDVPIVTEIIDVTFNPGDLKETWININFKKPESWNPNGMKWWFCWKLAKDHGGAKAGEIVCRFGDNLGQAGPDEYFNVGHGESGYPFAVFVTNKENTQRSQLYYVDYWPSTHGSKNDDPSKTNYQYCYDNLSKEFFKSLPLQCTWWADKVSRDLERAN